MTTPINAAIGEHFRSPEGFFEFALRGALSEKAQHFRFDGDVACYGRCWAGTPQGHGDSEAYEASLDVQRQGAKCLLPFDPTEVADNLRRERYQPSGDGGGRLHSLVRSVYYLVRPLLPVALRRSMQRRALQGWDLRSFPSWPVDRTVDRLLEKLMILTLESGPGERVPFIWFWPEGKSGCIVMTHDVETPSGLASCDALMSLDDSFGVKSSFQIIPGGRYQVSEMTLDSVRSRGFELNVHDWNHDGSLFLNRALFLSRAARINEYAARWQASGFRSGALYRNSDWYDALDFSYDMSTPNVGHLDPQPGGCCTVMPYFIGRMLEIPVTTTQDYSLFHILKDYSIDLWKRQVSEILAGNGLASFIVHPDYIGKGRARATYTHLLEHLCKVRADENAWCALPGDVNRWWRERSLMRLVRRGNAWTIEGAGKERARVAYAQLQDGNLVYTVAGPNRAPAQQADFACLVVSV